MSGNVILRITTPLLCAFFGGITVAQAQTPEETAKSVDNVFAIGQSIHNAKVNNQNNALAAISRSFKALSASDYAQGLKEANAAISAYRRYSTPYLLGAYCWLKQGDAYVANKYLQLYYTYKPNAVNKEYNKKIPASFEQEVIKGVETGYKALSEADLNTKMQNAAWLTDQVTLDVDWTIAGADRENNLYKNTTPPSQTMPLIIGASYVHNYWFDARNKFSNIITKQYGVSGGARLFHFSDLGGGDVSSFPATIGALMAGVHLERFYIGVEKSLFVSFPSHSTTTGGGYYSSSSGTSGKNFFAVDLRYYSAFDGARATNRFRRNPSLLGSVVRTASYFFVKTNSIHLGGATSDGTETYNSRRTNVQWGVAFTSNTRVNVAIGMAWAENQIDLSRNDKISNNLSAYYNGTVTGFGGFIKVGVRVY